MVNTSITGKATPISIQFWKTVLWYLFRGLLLKNTAKARESDCLIPPNGNWWQRLEAEDLMDKKKKVLMNGFSIWHQNQKPKPCLKWGAPVTTFTVFGICTASFGNGLTTSTQLSPQANREAIPAWTTIFSVGAGHLHQKI